MDGTAGKSRNNTNGRVDNIGTRLRRLSPRRHCAPRQGVPAGAAQEPRLRHLRRVRLRRILYRHHRGRRHERAPQLAVVLLDRGYYCRRGLRPGLRHGPRESRRLGSQRAHGLVGSLHHRARPSARYLRRYRRG